MPKLIVTGASGLLGRAIYQEFVNQSWDVLGFAYSRVKDGLVKINLHDTEALQSAIDRFKPDAIIHSAAERFPDKVEKNYDASHALNVDCSGNLGKLAKEANAAFLFISTDYVFDGQNPPYKESDIPNPLNKYGVSKWEGEKEVTKANPDSCILRVPVLYGDEEYLGESAVSSILKDLLSENLKLNAADDDLGYAVSNFETRYPSCTNDIAWICFRLIELKLKEPSLNSIFHWCGKEALTKYEMALILADRFVSSSHIIPINEPPDDVTCSRPKNSKLSCERLEKLGIGRHTNFSDGILLYKKFMDKNLGNK